MTNLLHLRPGDIVLITEVGPEDVFHYRKNEFENTFWEITSIWSQTRSCGYISFWGKCVGGLSGIDSDIDSDIDKDMRIFFHSVKVLNITG